MSGWTVYDNVDIAKTEFPLPPLLETFPVGNFLYGGLSVEAQREAAAELGRPFPGGNKQYKPMKLAPLVAFKLEGVWQYEFLNDYPVKGWHNPSRPPPNIGIEGNTQDPDKETWLCGTEHPFGDIYNAGEKASCFGCGGKKAHCMKSTVGWIFKDPKGAGWALHRVDTRWTPNSMPDNFTPGKKQTGHAARLFWKLMQEGMAEGTALLHAKTPFRFLDSSLTGDTKRRVRKCAVSAKLCENIDRRFLVNAPFPNWETRLAPLRGEDWQDCASSESKAESPKARSSTKGNRTADKVAEGAKRQKFLTGATTQSNLRSEGVRIEELGSPRGLLSLGGPSETQVKAGLPEISSPRAPASPTTQGGLREKGIRIGGFRSFGGLGGLGGPPETQIKAALPELSSPQAEPPETSSPQANQTAFPKPVLRPELEAGDEIDLEGVWQYHFYDYPGKGWTDKSKPPPGSVGSLEVKKDCLTWICTNKHAVGRYYNNGLRNYCQGCSHGKRDGYFEEVTTFSISWPFEKNGKRDSKSGWAIFREDVDWKPKGKARGEPKYYNGFALRLYLQLLEKGKTAQVAMNHACTPFKFTTGTNKDHEKKGGKGSKAGKGPEGAKNPISNSAPTGGIPKGSKDKRGSSGTAGTKEDWTKADEGTDDPQKEALDAKKEEAVKATEERLFHDRVWASEATKAVATIAGLFAAFTNGYLKAALDPVRLAALGNFENADAFSEFLRASVFEYSKLSIETINDICRVVMRRDVQLVNPEGIAHINFPDPNRLSRLQDIAPASFLIRNHSYQVYKDSTLNRDAIQEAIQLINGFRALAGEGELSVPTFIVFPRNILDECLGVLRQAMIEETPDLDRPILKAIADLPISECLLAFENVKASVSIMELCREQQGWIAAISLVIDKHGVNSYWKRDSVAFALAILKEQKAFATSSYMDCDTATKVGWSLACLLDAIELVDWLTHMLEKVLDGHELHPTFIEKVLALVPAALQIRKAVSHINVNWSEYELSINDLVLAARAHYSIANNIDFSVDELSEGLEALDGFPIQSWKSYNLIGPLQEISTAKIRSQSGLEWVGKKGGSKAEVESSSRKRKRL